MNKSRLEAFSDGVIAIIITIMVLELHIPPGPSFLDLGSSWVTLFGYAISFTYLGVYWINHHRLIHYAPVMSWGIMWANLLLLFSLSLIPFFTQWVTDYPGTVAPTFAYCVILEFCAVCFTILYRAIIAKMPLRIPNQRLFRLSKNSVSQTLYVVSAMLSFFAPVVSYVLIAVVAAVWAVPWGNARSNFAAAARGSADAGAAQAGTVAKLEAD